MSSLRVEFVLVGGGRGRLGGQVDVRDAEPLASYTLTVGPSAPAPSGQPLVPAGFGTVFAEIGGADLPVYVDIGPAPDPSAEPRLLVMPGVVQRLRVTPGHRVSAVLANDVAQPSAGTLTRANATFTEAVVVLPAATWTLVSAANGGRQKLVLADPVGIGCVWSRQDAAPAPTYPGGVPFSLSGSPGTWVFDDPVPRGAIFAKAANTGSLTVVEA